MKHLVWFLIALLTPCLAIAGAQKPLTIVGGQVRQQHAGDTIIVTDVSHFAMSPNYVGSVGDSSMVGVVGSSSSPSALQGAVGMFEKFDSASGNSSNALAALAFKYSSTANHRTTAIYGEATDLAGGSRSFVEGGRFQGTIGRVTNGSAYGLVCAAGAPRQSSTPQYVIACEANPINQRGPDASTYGSFDKDTFTAAFVASNGCPGCGSYNADAAFVTNPYSEKPFRTGLLFGEGSVNDTAIAFRPGLSIVAGIDMHLAMISYSAISIPNDVPIRAMNAAGTSALSVLKVDRSSNLQVGADVTANISLGSVLRLKGYTVATLPACAAGTKGDIAHATDLSAVTYNATATGGGSLDAPVYCNGLSWNVR